MQGCPHLARIFLVGAAFQQLEDFEGNLRQGLGRNADGPECLELGEFLLEMLHTRRGRLGFELIKGGLRVI